MTTTVTATFKTYNAAEQALLELEAMGFAQDNISVVVADNSSGHSFNLETESKAPEGATTGGVAGGLLGGIAAALASTGAIAIPGANLLVAGWLISALAGAGAGALTGGLLGALVGAGIPEHEAKHYENEIKNGAVLVAVEAEDKDKEAADRVKEMLKRQDAYHIAA